MGNGVLTTGGDNSSTDFAGIISGSGSLVKEGTGTFTLSGSNAFIGGTTIDEGTLALSSGGSLESSSGILTGPSGTFLVGSGTYAVKKIDGSGSTVFAENAILATERFCQDSLNMGIGSKLIITPLSGFPLTRTSRTTPVPEPGCLVYYVFAIMIWAGIYLKRSNLC